MLHRRIYGQALIGELFFGGKIVIQRILDTVPVRIGHGIAVQHPLFLGDVVLTNLSRVTEHALKQPAVDGEPLGGENWNGRESPCNSGFCVLYCRSKSENNGRRAGLLGDGRRNGVRSPARGSL